MGRYYSGDIEGKFWFAVQSSDDPSFFGGEQCEPNYIEYYFNSDDLPKIEAGLEKCRKKLGDDKKVLDEFFEKHNGYNDHMFYNEVGWDKDTVQDRLQWYARLQLGEKIYKCVKENGQCSFEAEL